MYVDGDNSSYPIIIFPTKKIQVRGKCVRPPPPPLLRVTLFLLSDGYPIAVCCYCDAPEVNDQN